MTPSTSTTASPTLTIGISTPSQNILYYSTLKAQLREFIRQYIYLFVVCWWLAVTVVNWVMRNRIYSTKEVRNYTLND